MSNHVVVRASAGAGKTYQLTNRFLGLVMRGVPVDAILAATFSRKAAGEIIERVLVRLARAVSSDEEALALSRAIGVTARRADFEKKLEHVAGRLHRLSIGTLDAFFMGLAQSFGAELGFVPGWRVLDEAVETTLRRRAVVNGLQSFDDAELQAVLLDLSRGEQKQSVVERLDALFAEVFQTYVSSDATAWEAPPLQEPRWSVADALAALERVNVADAKLALCRSEDVARARHEGMDGFLCKGIAAKVLEGDTTYSRKPLPDGLQRAYRDVFAAYAVPLRAELRAQTRATYHMAQRIAVELWREKLTLRGYAFDDVSRMLAQRVATVPLDEMYYRLDQRVQCLLLDEFQDTSLAQWNVLRPLAAEVTGDAARGFYCVGDVKQAIYGWRGGVRQIFDAISEQLALDTETLDKSYRSSPVIMEAVNRLFGSLDANEALQGHDVTPWMRGFSPHATARTDLSGHVCVLAATSKETVWPEAADEIARLHTMHPEKSIGVLVRRNKAVAELIGLLGARGVQASEEGGNPVIDTRAVRLVLSALRVADHPGDTVSRFHVARSPLGLLSDWRDTRAAEALSVRLRERVAAVGFGQLLRELATPLGAVGRDAARLEQLIDLGERFSRQVLPDAQQALRLSRFIEFVVQTKMEEPTASPVRVMTIHQAKGLEFDLVVATDLEEKLFESGVLLTERPTPLDAPARVSRDVTKVQRALLPELHVMAAQANQRELDEALSNLYVTVTRARRAFTAIVAPSSKSETVAKTTLAGILRAGLAPGSRAEPGTVVYEAGEPLAAAETQVQRVPAESAAVVLRLKASGRRPQRQSPSSLEGGAAIALGEHLRLERRTPLARGALAHAWLESIEWLEDFTLDEGKLRQAMPPEARGVPFEVALGEFKLLVAQPEVRRVLSKSTFAAGARVYRELPFALREGEDLLSGQLDRVVVEGGKLTVIDYKTDRITSDDELAKRVAFYRPQIDAYRRAAARVFRVEQTAGWLLFLHADQTIAL